MEQYTDDERVEDLKKWWRDNGLSIIAGIVLGVAAIFGWRYWNTYRDTQAEQASLRYDAFIKAVEKPDNHQARQSGQALLADFPGSPYAALTALRLAKLAMDGGDNTTAIQQLQWVIDNTKLAELGDIARLRLARIWFVTDQLSDAKKLLDTVNTASLTMELEELRGDIYLAGNDTAKARAAYTAALAAGGANRILQIKLDNLAVPTADTVITAPAPPPPVAHTPTALAPEAAPTPESTPELPVPAAKPVPEPVSAAPAVGSAPEPAVTEPAPVQEPVAAEPAAEPVAAKPALAEPEPATKPALEPVATEPAPAEAAPKPTEPAEAEPAPAEAAPKPAEVEPASVESTLKPAVIEPAPAPAPVESVPATGPAPISPVSTSGPPS